MNLNTPELLNNSTLAGLIFETASILNAATDNGKLLSGRTRRIHRAVNKMAQTACCTHIKPTPGMDLLEALSGAIGSNPDNTLYQLLDSLAVATTSLGNPATEAVAFMELDAAWSFFQRDYLA